MEQRDWVLGQTDVKLRSVPFIKATRYRRPDWSSRGFRQTTDSSTYLINHNIRRKHFC